MANNPLPDTALAELDRLHKTAIPLTFANAAGHIFNAYPALRQRLLDAESRLAEAERERDVYHAALSEIYYRAIPLNEDSGHSTIAHIAADAMRGNNGNPFAARDADLRAALEEINESLCGITGAVNMAEQVAATFNVLNAALARTPAQSLARCKAEALNSIADKIDADRSYTDDTEDGSARACDVKDAIVGGIRAEADRMEKEGANGR